jgi:hypothetical protein
MTEDAKQPKKRLGLPEAAPQKTAEPTFWLVWNPKRGNPTMQHASRDKAQAEAERLANAAPGDLFYVMQAVSLTRTTRVETVELAEGGAA